MVSCIPEHRAFAVQVFFKTVSLSLQLNDYLVLTSMFVVTMISRIVKHCELGKVCLGHNKNTGESTKTVRTRVPETLRGCEWQLFVPQELRQEVGFGTPAFRQIFTNTFASRPSLSSL